MQKLLPFITLFVAVGCSRESPPSPPSAPHNTVTPDWVQGSPLPPVPVVPQQVQRTVTVMTKDGPQNVTVQDGILVPQEKINRRPVGKKAADQTVSEPIHGPTKQITITDEHGTRVITVPANAAPAAPPSFATPPDAVPMIPGLPAVPRKDDSPPPGSKQARTNHPLIGRWDADHDRGFFRFTDDGLFQCDLMGTKFEGNYRVLEGGILEIAPFPPQDPPIKIEGVVKKWLQLNYTLDGDILKLKQRSRDVWLTYKKAREMPREAAVDTPPMLLPAVPAAGFVPATPVVPAAPKKERSQPYEGEPLLTMPKDAMPPLERKPRNVR